MKLIFAMILSAVLVTFAFQSEAATGKGCSPFSAEYVYSYADLGGATGFQSLVGPKNPLPKNSVVLSGHWQVLDAFTSSGSATVAIGDAASGSRYQSAVAYDNAIYTVDAPVAAASGMPFYVDTVNEANVGVTIGTAALTGGKMRVVLDGYVPCGQ